MAHDDRHDEFGFLPENRDITFAGGTVRRLPTYEMGAKWISDNTHNDGHIYPGILRSGAGRSEVGPKTDRPALVFHLPISHGLAIDGPPIGTDFRRNDGAFLLHLLAYLFGVRLQFRGWGVDGRIPTDESRWFCTTPARETAFLSQCYATWKTWGEDHRRWMINILFMNSKSPCHEWDWERFAINYMVFDGLYALSKCVAGVATVSHGDRYDAMQKVFGLAPDERVLPSDSKMLFRSIADLRNRLLHQALWDQTTPGELVSERAWRSVWWLRRINERIIPAVFGFKTPCIGARVLIDGACPL